MDPLPVPEGSHQLPGMPTAFTFASPPILPSGSPPSTPPPAPILALPPTTGPSDSDAPPHFSPTLDVSSPVICPFNDAASIVDAVPVTAPRVPRASVATPTPPVAHPSNKENEPAAGPSTGTRVQPKRKRAIIPTLVPASGPKPPRKASSKKPSPAAAAAGGPPRKRRKVAELEDIEMTPETRCGLGGCATIFRAPNLTTARAHLHAHITPPPPLSRPEGSSAKGKERAAEQAEQPQEKTPLHCSYRTLAGAACTHAPLSNEQALQRHIEGEHYRWKFPCKGCGKRFPRRDALGRHHKTKPRCRPSRAA